MFRIHTFSYKRCIQFWCAQYSNDFNKYSVSDISKDEKHGFVKILCLIGQHSPVIVIMIKRWLIVLSILML